MARGGKRENAGRPLGVPNKINGDVKAMLREALERAGGADYLLEQSEKNPSAFMALVGKAFITEKTANEQSGTLTLKWDTNGGNSYTLRTASSPAEDA